MSSFKKVSGHRKRVEKERKRRAKEREGQSFFPFRAVIGETRKVILLDDTESVLGYHELFRGLGNRPLYYKCLAEEHVMNATEDSIREAHKLCPFCKEGIRLLLGPVFTAFLIEKWTSSNGEKKHGYRGLLVAEGPPFRVLYRRYLRLQKKGKTLAGTIWEVTRGGKKNSPRIGDTWDFINSKGIEHFRDRYKMDKDECVPFDYNKIPMLLSRKEAKVVVKDYVQFKEDSGKVPF